MKPIVSKRQRENVAARDRAPGATAPQEIKDRRPEFAPRSWNSSEETAQSRIMSEPALQRTVLVANRAGMHARAAMAVAVEARRFDAKVLVSKGHHCVEAADIIQLMSLGAFQGDQLSLEGSGNDALAAVNAIEQLFLRKFDED